MTQENKKAVELGSQGNWVAIRATEALALLLIAPVLYWLKPPQGWELVLEGVLLAAVLVVWDPVAHGFADEKGIRYRHYFAWRFLPWEQVERIDWSSAWIVAVRRGASLLRRRTVFPLQRSMGDALAEARGRPLPEPAAVTQLKEYAQARGLELRGIERVRPKHAMVALALFLLIVVAVAWAWWTLLRP